MPDRKFPFKDDGDKPAKSTIFLLTYSIVLVFALLNAGDTMSFISWIISILSPFLLGLFFAFILDIAIKQMDRYLFRWLNNSKSRVWHRIHRGVSVLLAFMIAFAILAALISFIIPQIASSINMLINNLPNYVTYLQDKTSDFLIENDIQLDQALPWDELTQYLINILTGIVSNLPSEIIHVAGNVTSFLFTFTMGIIFSIYLLMGKKRILLSVKRMIYAYLPRHIADRIYQEAHLAGGIFANFVVGQLTEAVILGTMYFVGTSMFRMPYAPLISTTMALCSLIPMFGIFIGAVPSVLILMMVDSSLAFAFIIMVVVFQQIEGNFIYPRVVGGSIGLPGVWVLLSIIVGGALFGPFGMVLAVPMASVLYAITGRSVRERLRKKHTDLYTFELAEPAAKPVAEKKKDGKDTANVESKTDDNT